MFCLNFAIQREIDKRMSVLVCCHFHEFPSRIVQSSVVIATDHTVSQQKLFQMMIHKLMLKVKKNLIPSAKCSLNSGAKTSSCLLSNFFL